MYDLIIIGSGPAGLSASVYASRAMLDTLVFEKAFTSGGQIINTYDVDNYLGLPDENGYELSQKFRKHADKLGMNIVSEDVASVEDKGKYKLVITKEVNTYETKTVILAMGAHHRVLGIKGEDIYIGKGVSYCATCDGAFFRGKTVAVVGGGDVALEDALFLARACEKVYIILRRDVFRGAKILQNNVKNTENIEIIYNTVVEEIMGDSTVDSIKINTKGDKKTLEVKGVFVAIGIEPETQAVKDTVALDEGGYIIADESGKTSVSGIFAAGDIRTKALRQIITAASDGANCVNSVEKYLNS